MQKQKTATAQGGLADPGLASALISAPDVSAVVTAARSALEQYDESDRQTARSHNGVPGRWKPCPCGKLDCPLAEFIAD